MTMPFVADLHCHSTVSDGTLTPEEVAARAAINGVQLWALTDHDEVGGIAEAREMALEEGMLFLPGVEISVTYAQHTIHIVGLGIDENHEGLQTALKRLRSGRLRRAQAMGEKLAALGIPGVFESAVELAGNMDLVSRTHFARSLVMRGVCSSMNEVFARYLADGKPAHVPQQWAGLQESVGWIRAAGGVAVVAHPARYRFDATQEWAFFNDFKQCGGQAVEIATGSHEPHEMAHYIEVAQQFGLAHSCGSDFHAPVESQSDLGEIPDIHIPVPPVWDLLHERIERGRFSM